MQKAQSNAFERCQDQALQPCEDILSVDALSTEARHFLPLLDSGPSVPRHPSRPWSNAAVGAGPGTSLPCRRCCRTYRESRFLPRPVKCLLRRSAFYKIWRLCKNRHPWQVSRRRGRHLAPTPSGFSPAEKPPALLQRGVSYRVLRSKTS